jgi:hypothetical protein
MGENENCAISTGTSRKTRRAWFKADDDVLLSAVAQLGDVTDTDINWGVVSRAVPGRTPRSCRDRYWNHLCPGVAAICEWSAAHDEFLLAKVAELGPKMALIAKFFPDRRPADVKNRYYYHLRRGSSSCSATDALDPGSMGEEGAGQPPVEMAIVQLPEPARPETPPAIEATPSDFGWRCGWVDLCEVDESLLSCYAEMDSVDAFSFW